METTDIEFNSNTFTEHSQHSEVKYNVKNLKKSSKITLNKEIFTKNILKYMTYSFVNKIRSILNFDLNLHSLIYFTEPLRYNNLYLFSDQNEGIVLDIEKLSKRIMLDKSTQEKEKYKKLLSKYCTLTNNDKKKKKEKEKVRVESNTQTEVNFDEEILVLNNSLQIKGSPILESRFDHSCDKKGAIQNIILFNFNTKIAFSIGKTGYIAIANSSDFLDKEYIYLKKKKDILSLIEISYNILACSDGVDIYIIDVYNLVVLQKKSVNSNSKLTTFTLINEYDGNILYQSLEGYILIWNFINETTYKSSISLNIKNTRIISSKFYRYFADSEGNLEIYKKYFSINKKLEKEKLEEKSNTPTNNNTNTNNNNNNIVEYPCTTFCDLINFTYVHVNAFKNEAEIIGAADIDNGFITTDAHGNMKVWGYSTQEPLKSISLTICSKLLPPIILPKINLLIVVDEDYLRIINCVDHATLLEISKNDYNKVKYFTNAKITIN
jgi:hypothetical protein